MSRRDDAASPSALHQAGALLLAERDAAPRLTSSEQQRVRLSRRIDAQFRNKGDFQKDARQDSGRSLSRESSPPPHPQLTMREIVHIQAGQCGNQIGAKVLHFSFIKTFLKISSRTPRVLPY